MKPFYLLLFGLLLISVGCKKADTTPATSEVVQGVKVDMPKLLQAFENAPPDMHATTLSVQLSMRYQKYVDALAGLDKLVNDNRLSEDQKKVVTAVIEQVKQLAAKTAATPGQ